MGLVQIHNYPLIRILVPMLGGIIFADLTLTSEKYLLNTLLLCVISLGFILLLVVHNYINSSYNKKHYFFGVSSYILFFLVGVLNTTIHNSSVKSISIQSDPYIAEITSDPSTNNNSHFTQYDLKLLNSGAKVRMFYLKDSLKTDSLPYGSIIAFNKEISVPKELGVSYFFDYGTYLRHKYYSGVVYLNKKDIIKLPTTLTRHTQDILKLSANTLEAKLLSYNLSADASSLLSALLLGDKKHLNDSMKRQFSTIGVSHVLALSGLHVGLIYSILIFILNLVLYRLKNKKIIILIIGVLSLWLFTLLTGASASVVRASLFFSLYALANLMGRKVKTFQILLSTAFIMLLFNPLWLFDIGFQLSFTAVLGIIFFTPLITSKISFKNKIIMWCVQLLAVSTAAQIGTLPLLLYYFGAFPVYFLLANFFVIPMITVLLYLGVPYLILCEIRVIEDILSILVNLVTKLLLQVVTFIGNLPYVSHIQYITLYQSAFIVLILVLFYNVCVRLTYKRLINLLTSLVVYFFISIKTPGISNNDYLVTLGAKPMIHKIENNKSEVILCDSTIVSEKLVNVFGKYWSLGKIAPPVVKDYLVTRDLCHSDENVFITKEGVSVFIPSYRNKPNWDRELFIDYVYVNATNIKKYFILADKVNTKKIICHENIIGSRKKRLVEISKAKNIEIIEIQDKAYLPLLR